MKHEHSDLVKEHFEMKYHDYDVLIKKLIPEYEQMHNMIVDQIDFPRDKNLSFLDLGVGTGQTALHLLKKYPHATIDGFDISPTMIEQAKKRLQNQLDRITFTEQDIKNLDISTKNYDACVAVLSVHHLDGQQKASLFKTIFRQLNENGIFVVGDIVKFDSESETKAKEDEWRAFLIRNLGEQEGQYWFENYQEEDLPSSVNEQLNWLQQAGFHETNPLWEYMNYAVFNGKKIKK